jgi:WXG100 family type VII secretion target
MTSPTVTPAEMKSAADSVRSVSEGVRDRVNFIRTAIETPANWSGATNKAVLELFAARLPALMTLSEKLDQASNVLVDNMNRFSMEDEVAAADVAKAAAATTGQGVVPGGAGAPAATGSIRTALTA